VNFNSGFKGNNGEENNEKYFQLRERLKRWEEAMESTVGKESNLSG
jgi:hypothetical protein